MKNIFFYFLLLFSSHVFSQAEKKIQNGYILAIGGGMDEEGLDQFLQLVGDTSNSIVIVPTACYDEYIYSENNCATYYQNYFHEKGYHHLEVMHTRSRDSANSNNFVQPLEKAKGVWFTGGRQPLLVDSYLNTLFHNRLESILSNGGVVGGSSAGATIMGSFLVRGQLKNNTIMIGDHTEGFGFLENTAIDQHVLARNRQFDLLEVVHKHPNILGIGIDEGTTIVVHQGLLEVVSGSYVAIYDGTFWDSNSYTARKLKRKSQQFYFLQKHDLYDLKERKVLTHLNKTPIEIQKKDLVKFEGTFQHKNDTARIETLDSTITINKAPLFPIKELEFFNPNNPNRYLFTTDAQGAINGLKIISYKAFYYEKVE